MYGEHIILATAAALEQLARHEATAARQARKRGEKEHAQHFQRNANAYTKALVLWQAGIRPASLPSGSYILPSQRTDEPGHLLTRGDYDWVCTCEAGESMHWAKAMIVGLEASGDYVNAGLVGDVEPEPEPAPAPSKPEPAPVLMQPVDLGRRLARARAQAEIDELFA